MERIPDNPKLDAEERAELSAEGAQEFAYYAEIGLRQLNHQFELTKLINQEATSAFTIGSTILPLFAAFAGSDWAEIRATPAAVAAMTLALLAYGLLIWSYRKATVASLLRLVPDLAQWQRVYHQTELASVQSWLGDACVAEYQINDIDIQSRTRHAGNAKTYLIAEVVCLTVAIIAIKF